MHPQHENARREAFGYRCNACSRCCQHKVIQVNPYEVARLARLTGMSFAEFRAACTEDGKGAILRRTENTDTCIFLGEKGCTVHPDRPLVCRLYPLGRRVTADGTESWVQVEPHPRTAGEYSKNGTIGDYVAAQGALPFMHAADAYAQWVRDATQFMEEHGIAPAPIEIDPADFDASVAAYCAANALAEPEDIEERHALHMKSLYQHLQRKEGNDG